MDSVNRAYRIIPEPVVQIWVPKLGVGVHHPEVAIEVVLLLLLLLLLLHELIGLVGHDEGGLLRVRLKDGAIGLRGRARRGYVATQLGLDWNRGCHLD